MKNVNEPLNINLTYKELFWTYVYLKFHIAKLNLTDTLSMDDNFMKDKAPFVSSLCSEFNLKEDELVPVFSNDKEKMMQAIEWRNELVEKFALYLSSSKK